VATIAPAKIEIGTVAIVSEPSQWQQSVSIQGSHDYLVQFVEQGQVGVRLDNMTIATAAKLHHHPFE
jgi:hypothetical protein